MCAHKSISLDRTGDGYVIIYIIQDTRNLKEEKEKADGMGGVCRF